MIDATLFGFNAYQELSIKLELTILKCSLGYYIGTVNDCGPVSRESTDYYRTLEAAQQSLGEGTWKQLYNISDSYSATSKVDALGINL